jgi:hypothetical protein
MVKNPYRFYTYAYLRDDRTPYYIGKGCYKRIYSKKGKPCGVPKDKSRIVFLKQNLTEEEAFRHEKYMIAVFGRKNLGTGILHNRTDGGDGCSGHIVTDKTKEKLKLANIGKKHSEKSKRKMSELAKLRTHTEETKRKIGESSKGRKSMLGKKLSKESIDKLTNSLCKHTYKLISPEGNEVIVKNLAKFCRDNNMNQTRLKERIDGKIKNPYKGWTGQMLENMI